MSDNNLKRKKYVNLGAVVTGKTGNTYIAVDKDVKLTINGIAFTGKYISLDSPADKYKRMLEKGSITEEEATRKIESIPDYIKKEVIAVLEQ